MPTKKATRSPDLTALKLSPEVAEYLKARGHPFPKIPPRWKTPEPRNVRGAVFDFDRVDQVLNSFKHLRHTQGKWAGKVLKPDPWQIAYVIAPVFGWVIFDVEAGAWVRIARKAYVEVGRKNGKTTLAGGIGLHLTGGDGEAGAQVLTAATTKDQAGFVFQPIKSLVEHSPALKRNFKAVGLKVLHKWSGSYLAAISSVADAQHGANIHGAIIDELHVHKSPDMLETIETGTGSRTQPLVLVITTADEATQGTVYDRRRTKIEQLARGVIRDPVQYGVIWCAEDTDDPFIEATWKKANPGYGVSPTRAYMRANALEAKNSPSELPKFLRLHLGIRKKQVARWVPLERYDATGQLIADIEWSSMTVTGGLDLSSSSDFTACVFRGRNGEHGYPVHMLCWLPEEKLGELERQCGVPLKRWAAEGWIKLTEGNIVDYSKVRADIAAEVTRLRMNVGSFGYDPWNATETVTELEASGYQMVPCRQGYGTLSAPTKQLQRLILGSTPEAPLIRTGGNPVLRWMVDCVEVRQDDNDNIKPVKPDRNKSSKRIDGPVAWIMAEREAMVTVDEQSNAGAALAAMFPSCSACNTPVPRSATRCANCGHDLTTSQAG